MSQPPSQFSKQKIIVVLGPTASGKSELAVRLAERFSGEIINADSMQVYKGMDIGTAKPPPEFLERAKHHLLDMTTPDVQYTAAAFCADAAKVIADIALRGKNVFVVGGTGLYIRGLLHGLIDSPCGDVNIRKELEEIAEKEGNELLLKRLSDVDPVTAARLHPNDQVRIIRALEVFMQSGIPISNLRTKHSFAGNYFNCLKIGISVEREELYRRINNRVDEMIAAGFIEEVQSLLNMGYSPELRPFNAIGYKEVCTYLSGEYALDKTVELIKRNTRRYAKRQLTWFLKESEINWVEYPKCFASICDYVIDFLV